MMQHEKIWLRTGIRLLLISLLLCVVFAPVTGEYAFADGAGSGQPGAPPCDTCAVGYVQPDEIIPGPDLVSRLEILLLTMPVTGI